MERRFVTGVVAGEACMFLEDIRSQKLMLAPTSRPAHSSFLQCEYSMSADSTNKNGGITLRFFTQQHRTLAVADVHCHFKPKTHFGNFWFGPHAKAPSN